jgi:hypothetical protein
MRRHVGPAEQAEFSVAEALEAGGRKQNRNRRHGGTEPFSRDGCVEGDWLSRTARGQRTSAIGTSIQLFRVLGHRKRSVTGRHYNDVRKSRPGEWIRCVPTPEPGSQVSRGSLKAARLAQSGPTQARDAEPELNQQQAVSAG